MDILEIGKNIQQQLFDISQESGQKFHQLCRFFVFERFLYRLGQSDYSNQFVLKGGMIIRALTNSDIRISKDLDFTGYGKPDINSVSNVFRSILAMEFEDGIKFNEAELEAKIIRDKEIYDGIRLTTTAKISNEQIKLQIDIGYGDKFVSPAKLFEYPSLLSFPRPVIRAYSIESVISEKFHAIVTIGRFNSRMKDFYDIWISMTSGEVNSERLIDSIQKTFTHRDTPIPTEIPIGLSQEFILDNITQERWLKFLERSMINPTIDLSTLVQEITTSLMHHASLANKIGEKTEVVKS